MLRQQPAGGAIPRLQDGDITSRNLRATLVRPQKLETTYMRTDVLHTCTTLTYRLEVHGTWRTSREHRSLLWHTIITAITLLCANIKLPFRCLRVQALCVAPSAYKLNSLCFYWWRTNIRFVTVHNPFTKLARGMKSLRFHRGYAESVPKQTTSFSHQVPIHDSTY